MPRAPKSRVVAALGLNQIFSSLTHIIAKGAVAAIGPLAVALIRFTIASSTLLVYQRLRGGMAIARGDRIKLVILGFFAGAGSGTVLIIRLVNRFLKTLD